MKDEEKKENPEETMQKQEATNNEKNEETGFWEGAIENIAEGAKILGEEAKSAGQKIGAYSEKIFGTVKEKTSEVMKSGLNLTKEAVNMAQKTAENLKDKYEIGKLNNEKRKVAAQLGIKFYLAFKNNDNKIPNGFEKNEKILSALKELEDIDKEILKLSEETETEKN